MAVAADHRTGVYRVNLDGTQFEEVRLFQHKACSEGRTHVPCPDLGYTYGLPRYIAFDPVGNTLYLSMHDSLGGGLFRMNSDGTQYEQVIGPDAVRNILGGRPIQDVSVYGGRIHFQAGSVNMAGAPGRIGPHTPRRARRDRRRWGVFLHHCKWPVLLGVDQGALQCFPIRHGRGRPHPHADTGLGDAGKSISGSRRLSVLAG